MENLYEKIAYLKGLAEGLEIEESKEGRVLVQLIDVLEEMNEDIDVLFDSQEELEEYVTFIDEDLAAVESDFYEFDEEYDDYDDFDYDEYEEYDEDFDYYDEDDDDED